MQNHYTPEQIVNYGRERGIEILLTGGGFEAPGRASRSFLFLIGSDGPDCDFDENTSLDTASFLEWQSECGHHGIMKRGTCRDLIDVLSGYDAITLEALGHLFMSGAVSSID